MIVKRMKVTNFSKSPTSSRRSGEHWPKWAVEVYPTGLTLSEGIHTESSSVMSKSTALGNDRCGKVD